VVAVADGPSALAAQAAQAVAVQAVLFHLQGQVQMVLPIRAAAAVPEQVVVILMAALVAPV